MSTRFYLPASGSAAVSPAYDSSWEESGAAARLPLVTTPSDTAFTLASAQKVTAASPGDVLIRQFVSDVLPAGSISGTFSLVIDAAEATSTADAFLQVVIRVVSGDGSTVRGTLYAGQTTTTASASSSSPAYEFVGGTNTSAARSRILSAVTLSGVTATAGDRIVVDLGYRSSNVGTTRVGSLVLGDPTATGDATLAVDGNAARPWIEFSQTLFAVGTTTITGAQGAEADTAQAGSATAGAVVTGSQGAETDTPRSGTTSAGTAVSGSQGAEADTAEGGSTTAGAIVAGGQSGETDTAQGGALGGSTVVSGGQGTEVDAGQGGSTTVGAVAAGAQGAETDSGQGGTTASGAVLTGGQAAETDAAQGGSVVELPPLTPIDLSTFVNLYGTTSWDGTALTGSVAYFVFPLYVDGAQAYTVEVDYTVTTGTGSISIHSALGPSEVEVDASTFGTLDDETGLAGTGTATLTIGPGVGAWDAAVAAGELFPAFLTTNVDITGIRTGPAWIPGTSAPVEPLTSDTTNDAYKLTLGGWGVATWEPAIVVAPYVSVGGSVISAIAYGPVTMSGTRPVFTYSEADRPRLRQRILLAGHDVTYDRGVPTPDVEYELADLLLYGPGSLALPAVSAAWEMGTAATEGLDEGPRVKVQLVDDFTDPENPTIEATIYKAFGLNPAVSGRHLVVELGGEAAGRLALRDSKVLFRDVLDISRLLWRELTDVGIRYLPRLGEPGIGINSLNFGGVGKLEKVEELLARATKKDGTQRAVLPDEAGVYRPYDKDTETAHFSVFVDDAFTVPDLSSDIAEKPTTIYATAISPSGMRIDGAAVPGLISTPAPDYPMDDDSSIVEGATNEDTDSGDGVSVMINRLGTVGLLDIRDTPGGFDEDVVDALAKLQRRAGLTGPVGEMTPALWRALWDLDETGRSGRWSSIQPTAEDPSTQRYLRSASGAVIGLNPDFAPNVIQVDESIDMGTGFRERQVQNWAETRVHTPGAKVWYGTITLHLGAVLAGRVDVGDTITAADLVDARLVQPGRHNLWVPNFDGGTLFGVSGVQVSADTVTFTVDTRHRPAREIWERMRVRRETRNDPARRMLGTRQSTQQKDAVRGFISWGGMVDRDVPLEPGWNVIDVVVGDHGTIAWIETVVQSVTGEGEEIAIEGQEYAVAVFGKPITAARLNSLVPSPLTTEGEKAWRRRASRKELKDHGFLYAVGTQEEPCGYGEDIKSDSAPLTGRFVDDAGFVYDCEDYRARLCVYVREGVTDAKLLKGRNLWPVLEGGI